MLRLLPIFFYVVISYIFAGTANTLHAKSNTLLKIEKLDDVSAYVKENLPLEGELKKKNSGYWYVKVQDTYISKIYPQIEKLLPPGFRAVNYERRSSGIGAHISVVYENEKTPKELEKNLGKIYKFIPKGFKIVRGNRKKEFAVLVIDSPELEKLRGSAKLTPLLQGHEFHISIAERRKSKK